MILLSLLWTFYIWKTISGSVLWTLCFIEFYLGFLVLVFSCLPWIRRFLFYFWKLCSFSVCRVTSCPCPVSLPCDRLHLFLICFTCVQSSCLPVYISLCVSLCLFVVSLCHGSCVILFPLFLYFFQSYFVFFQPIVCGPCLLLHPVLVRVLFLPL